MPRTAGAKDKRKRLMSPNSLMQMPVKRQGNTSYPLRINAPTADYRWFERLTPLERGQQVTAARQRQDDPRSELL